MERGIPAPRPDRDIGRETAPPAVAARRDGAPGNGERGCAWSFKMQRSVFLGSGKTAN